MTLDRIRFRNAHLSWLALVGGAWVLRVSIAVFSNGWDPDMLSDISRNYWLKGYAPVALLLLVADSTVRTVGAERLRLSLYYAAWLNLLYPRLCSLRDRHSGLFARLGSGLLQRLFDAEETELILGSRKPAPYDPSFWSRIQAGEQKKPTVVRRRHLDARSYWPDWAFSEVLVFDDPEIRCLEGDDGRHFDLKVDLEDQNLGIYNNAGKQFLTDRFLTERRHDRLREQSFRVDAFLEDADPGDTLTVDSADAPFRWASAGVLPVTRYRDRWWYVFHFRGVPPVGWNLAVGGSESEEEYRKLQTLTLREFCEETVLLDRPPEIEPSHHVRQKVFRPSDRLYSEVPESYQRKLVGHVFSERHRRLRADQDDLHIEPVDGPRLTGISTPYSVTVETGDGEPARISDVLFSVNPEEFGIEVVALYTFPMERDDYLMFGELWEAGDCPLRQPMLLLARDYVERQHRETGSVGEPTEGYPYLDCRRLAHVPSEDYRLFGRDLHFRRRRLASLQEADSLPGAAENELSLHTGWFDSFGRMFEELVEERPPLSADRHEAATTLCPVTWKSLVQIHRADIQPEPIS